MRRAGSSRCESIGPWRKRWLEPAESVTGRSPAGAPRRGQPSRPIGRLRRTLLQHPRRAVARPVRSQPDRGGGGRRAFRRSRAVRGPVSGRHAAARCPPPPIASPVVGVGAAQPTSPVQPGVRPVAQTARRTPGAGGVGCLPGHRHRDRHLLLRSHGGTCRAGAVRPGRRSTDRPRSVIHPQRELALLRVSGRGPGRVGRTGAPPVLPQPIRSMGVRVLRRRSPSSFCSTACSNTSGWPPPA